MRLFGTKTARLVAPVALTLLLGGSAYAFMASNQVDYSSAGSGQQTITGYNVSDISYTLSAKSGDPDNITHVSFKLTPQQNGLSASQVAVWFNDDKSNVVTNTNGCTIGTAGTDGSETVTCDLTGLDLEASTPVTLHVAAAH